MPPIEDEAQEDRKEKRPTTNVRVFIDTVESMRDEKTFVRKATGVEPDFSVLVEAAWATYLKSPERLGVALSDPVTFDISSLSPDEKKLAESLIYILRSPGRDFSGLKTLLPDMKAKIEEAVAKQNRKSTPGSAT